jgi:UDP-N-acetylglucosamine 2-epimerase
LTVQTTGATSSLVVGTVNIGDRQSGRVKAESISDCKDDVESMKRAFAVLFSEGFLNRIKAIQNPYYLGDASSQIVKKLKTRKNIVKKTFYNIVWAIKNEKI